MERGGTYGQNNYSYNQYDDRPIQMTAQVEDGASNGLALASMIIGIISMVGACCFGGFLGLIGLILGIIALANRQCHRKGMAIAGIILSGLAFMITITVMIAGIASDDETISVNNIAAIEKDITEKNNNSSTVKNETSDTNDELYNQNESIKVDNKNKNTQEAKYEILDTQFYTFVNNIGSGEYYFLMEIKNTGDCDIYLDECYVDLEDSTGKLLQTGDTMSNCPSVIKPGEVGYFYNGVFSNLLDDNVNIKDVDSIVPHVEIVPATKECIEYPISDITITEEYGCAKIIGRVTNNTDDDDSGVYINVVFYNSEDKVIGITGTNVYDIKAGETKGFDCSSMYMAGDSKCEDIARCKVIAQKDYWQW